jgi:hypothetical protein
MIDRDGDGTNVQRLLDDGGLTWAGSFVTGWVEGHL